MPKHTFKISGDTSQELDDSGFYDGEKPPAGVYDVTLKQMRLKKNKNDDDMINALYEISEPKSSDKAKYNGYGIWDNINVTDSGIPFVNRFLDGFGFPRSFWESGCVTDDEDPPNITKIGNKRVTGDQTARIGTRDETYQGNTRLNFSRFVKAKDADDDEDMVDDEIEGVSLEEPEDDSAETDPYTEEELEGLELADLKKIAAEYEIKLTPRARAATVIALILEAQEANAEEDAEEAVEEADDDEATEALTEDELEEMELPDLKEYADSIDLEYPPKITKSKLIVLIINAQEAEEPEAEEEAEEASDDDAVSEDDLQEMELAELKEYAETLGAKIPKPLIKSRLIKSIVAAQEAKSSEPPF